jgi:hypothetical protein
MYLNYASSLPESPLADNSRFLPESPIYSPFTDFLTLVRQESCRSYTYELLSDVRDITDLFLSLDAAQPAGQQDSTSPASSASSDTVKAIEREIHALYRKIISLPPASRLGTQVGPGTLETDWIYESCRIAAVIQATAIAKRVPLSSVATLANRVTPSPRSTPLRTIQRQERVSSSHSPAASARQSRSPSAINTQIMPDTSTLLAELKTAIEMSSYQKCWIENNMTGVLLWITLVGGTAAANFCAPSPVSLTPPMLPSASDRRRSSGSLVHFGTATPTTGTGNDYLNFMPSSAFSSSFGLGDDAAPSPEDKLLRKWLVALAIRCCVLLVFDHRKAVVETLGRFLSVSTGLIEAQKLRHQKQSAPDAGSKGKGKEGAVMGPVGSGWSIGRKRRRGKQ